MNFGEKLKKLRTDAHLTRNELSEQSGISYRTLQNWETGSRNPSNVEAIERVAKALGVATSDLLDPDEQFVVAANSQYGSRGRKDAEGLLQDVTALFAGGEMDEEDMDVFMRGVQDAYWKVKEKNREKFTPKKYRE